MVKSIKIYKNFDIKLSDKGSIILIGNFDGLHLGHQKLFKLAKNFKKKYSIKIGVLTFEPMPKMFFDHKLKNFRISNQKQKINLLKSFNVDFVIVKKFDRSFSKTKSINFIKKIIGLKLKPRFIFVSNNFRFGNKREGNVKQLIKYESKCNFKIIKPKPLTKSKKIISSTSIRKLIQKGNLSQANKFLGRTWTIQGKVSKGRQLGKKIGFPTANINIENYIQSKKNSFNFSPVILRFATAFGLSPRMRFDLTVNEFTIDLLFKKTLEVYDAETWRPYFHTKDFANTILQIIDVDKELLKNEI